MREEIEWLKREIHKELETWHGVEGGIDEEGINKIMSLINQLDKFETLSQAWIDENHFETENWAEDLYKSDGGTNDHTPYIKVIAVQDLQKQLVPKQELPVIPKFVADFIEEVKTSGDSLDDAYALLRGIYHQSGVADWMAENKKNSELFAKAWLYGFTVEKEKKYIVKLPMSKNNDNQYAIVDDSGDIWTDALPSKYKLTEEEIRGLNKGDVLFEHFAVKVEELEE